MALGITSVPAALLTSVGILLDLAAGIEVCELMAAEVKCKRLF